MDAFNPKMAVTEQVRKMGLPLHCDGKETLLYRFFGSGRLLYIGVTVAPANRWIAHSRSAAWWPLVDSVSLETKSSKRAAEDAERLAIVNEAPEFNIRSAIPQRVAESPRTQVRNSPRLIPQGNGKEGNGREVGRPSISKYRVLTVARRALANSPKRAPRWMEK